MERIGFGPRFFAMAIDRILAAVAVFIASLAIILLIRPPDTELLEMLSMDPRSGFALTPPSFELVVAILVIFAIDLAYWSTEIFLGTSPGKLLMGLWIGSTDGDRAERPLLVRRFAFKHTAGYLVIIGFLLASLPLHFFGKLCNMFIFLGYFVVFGEGQQALHDKLAGTAVYRGAPRNRSGSEQLTPRMGGANGRNFNDRFKSDW